MKMEKMDGQSILGAFCSAVLAWIGTQTVNDLTQIVCYLAGGIAGITTAIYNIKKIKSINKTGKDV